MTDPDAPRPPPAGTPTSVKLALLIGGALVIALGAWVVADGLGDEAVEPSEDLPPLPEPGEPRTRPMVSSGGGFGWTWVNPRPQALPTLLDVDVADRGARALMVGHRGAALRYDDDGLHVVRTGTEETLRGVAWIGAREAVVVGEHGVVIRVGDGEPTPVESGVEVDLRDVEATAEGEAIAVGDEGTALAIGPDGATPIEAGTDEDLLAVFVRGEDRFLAGGGGTVVRLGAEGVTREPTGVSRTLRGIGGCAEGSVYASGDRGALLRRLSDGTWRSLRVPEQESFTDVSCDHGRVAAVTSRGRVYLVSGDTTVELPSGFDRVWHAVDGGGEGPSWIVGIGGRLATIEHDHVRTRTAGPTHPIRALGVMGGALVAVGEWGQIIAERETGFAERESPTESGLAALAQLDAGRLLAVGDFGAIVDIRHDRATLRESPTEASLRGVVGVADDLLMVGAGGAVVRGPLGGLRVTVLPETGDLHGLVGAPSDALAVGDGGAVLRLSERGFSRVDCEVSVALRGVGRWPIGAWAVGDEGVILRVHEDGCVVEHRGGPALHAVGLGPEGRPLAVGDEGTALERGEDGTWRRASLDVGRASLRVVYRTDRFVYVAGTGGVIARHIKVDGT